MADDIKIKLGLDAAALFAGLQKAFSELSKLAGIDLNIGTDQVVSDLNKLQSEAKQSEQALDKMADTDLNEVATDANKLAKAVENVGESAKKSNSLFDGIKQGLGDAFSGGFVGGLIGGGVANAAATGIGAIADGFGAIMTAGKELVSAQGNLQAATGATGAEFEQLKSSAEDAFLGGVGGSLAEATTAITNAKLALKDALPNDQIGEFVKNAGALGALYDKDVNEVVAKSAPFVRQFGLDGKKAFDLIAFASKEGKTSQDDVLDTLAEYSQLLSEAGFSAEEFAGQMAVAGQEGLFNTDKIADSIKEAQIRLKAGDTAKAITDLQGSLPKALGSTMKELEGLASSGQITIKEFLQRSGGAIEEAFSAGDISDAMRSQLQVAIAGTPAEDIGAEGYARMFGAPIPAEQIAAKAAQAGREAQSAAGQYLTFDAFTKKMELAFAEVSQMIVVALDGVFKTLSPIIDFVSNNLGTIGTIIGAITAAFAAYNIVVGIGTAVTTAYAAVQTALGGTISIATAAQYAWNLAMSLNPVGAVVAAVAVLGAGIYALTDALSVSAEETREQAEANVEMIESQKKVNEEQTVMTKGTKSMADEFIKLSEKKKLTNAETARMKQLTGDLSREYPDLVKNTSSYKENLSGVQSIANQAGKSLDSLARESAKLDKALQSSNQTLAFAKRNEAIQEAQSLMKTLGVVTDSYGLSAVNAFADLLYQADTVDKATDAYNRARKELGNNAKALSVVGEAYQQQIAAINAFKKKTEEVIDTNKKLDTSGGGGGGRSKAGRTAAADASEFKKASEAYSDYLDEIEIKRKEAIDRFEDQGLNKEEIQVKLSEDPTLSPKAEEVRAKIKELFKTSYDENGNLQLGIKFGKDEDKGDATRNIRKLIADADKFEIRLKAGISSKPADFKDLIKSLEEITKDAATNAQILVPVDGVNTKKALDQITNDTLKYVDFVKSQNNEIAQAQAEALAAGNTEQAAQFATFISNNNQSISLIEERLKRFKEKSQKAIADNQIQNQIGIALQTSILDVFNSERLRKEKETNDQIRAERLGALDSEEKDLTSSLAKREISFEEFAAKMSEIDKNRQSAMESTEVTFAERLKEVQDKTIGSILRSQSVAITGFVTDQFKDAEGNISETGKVAGDAMTQLTTQFAALAESGKATLGDFGNAAAAVAFDAVSKMIPSFVAGILGSSITALGPIAGPIAAGLLTGTLQLLIGQAKASLGFKDGVIDLEGPGTETSDSIPAWLSKGESVITASSTRANKDELAWMNANPGMSIRDYFMASSPAVRYAVSEDGDLIKEVRKLREETRGLGRQINRNTHVEISGELRADSNSIKAMIETEKRRIARRG